jgi:hypothetical protein
MSSLSYRRSQIVLNLHQGIVMYGWRPLIKGLFCGVAFDRECGLVFYTHISDQYGPFHGKIISATMGEAPHVLDGPLHHGAILTIKEH